MATSLNESATEAAAVFDSVGAAYEDAFKGLSTQAAAVQWLIDQLPKTGGASVIDLGCGTGRPVCSMLADAGHKVLGIDISDGMLDAARERVPNASFTKADVRVYVQEQVAKGGPPTLDGVAIFFSLIACMSPDEIREVIAGVAKLMKPGAALAWATVPMPAANERIKWMGRSVIVSSLSVEDALAAVRTAGLEIIDHVNSTYLPKAVEAGICTSEDVWEEPHLFVYAKKPVA